MTHLDEHGVPRGTPPQFHVRPATTWPHKPAAAWRWLRSREHRGHRHECGDWARGAIAEDRDGMARALHDAVFLVDPRPSCVWDALANLTDDHHPIRRFGRRQIVCCVDGTAWPCPTVELLSLSLIGQGERPSTGHQLTSGGGDGARR